MEESAQQLPVTFKSRGKYLCICAGSAASERLFNNSGNVVTPKRSCLKPYKVNMLVFLAKKNLVAGYYFQVVTLSIKEHLSTFLIKLPHI